MSFSSRILRIKLFKRILWNVFTDNWSKNIAVNFSLLLDISDESRHWNLISPLSMHRKSY
jgi:hypothetical protein